MRFICPLFPYDRWGGVEPLTDAVRLAERLGYDALGLPEHVVMPLRAGIDPVSVMWYDNFVLAAHLAARTSRIRFVFHALVIPYRPPVQTAKQVATLDVVSGGRVTLVAGSGWMRREFQVLGVAFEERGDITDEYLRAMRELWTNPTPSFHGARVAFDGIAFAPRCVQSPHVPLWIGGSGPRPMRRLIELGDGWAPMTGTLAEVAGQVARLREALAAAGRDPTRLDVVHGLRAGPADAAAVTASAHASRRSAADADAEAGEAGVSTEELVDRVGRSAAAGVTDVAVSFAWASPAEHAERLEWFATEVMSRCDRGTG